MTTSPLRRLLAALAVAAATALPAPAQDDRRGRNDPSLIVETGGRTGACDVLTFTPDGRHLLAAGDDKVVRDWPVDGDRIDRDNAHVLRWGVWREQRGSIYAVALDAEAKRVAVGGFGQYVGNVSVLDRASGRILHSMPNDGLSAWAVWSLAFAPDGNAVAIGKGDGSVWVWDLRGQARRLGKHPGSAGAANPVRLVTFTGPREVVSVAGDGTVLAWNRDRPGDAPQERFRFRQVQGLFTVAVSSDGRWVAAGGQSDGTTGGANRVEVRSLDGTGERVIELPARNYPRCLAFSPDGGRLAVGCYHIPPGATFQTFRPAPVFLCDLTDRSPRAVPGPTTTMYAEAVAFHPQGTHLAVAGGANHEVALWRIDGGARKADEVSGPGKCLWGVGLDKDNRLLLGFRDQAAAEPNSPNGRGEGPWRLFDLKAQRWAEPGTPFDPQGPIERSEDGWTIAHDPRNAFTWYAVNGTARHPLPLDRARDLMPRCYTFLRSEPGKPTRLAVGHLYGVSIFELTPAGVRRVRLFTGHAGEVSAVAPSPDGRMLVSAGRDQTVSAWSLDEWPAQSELGAAFELRNGKPVVTRLDAGSPAWEAGLQMGDEVAVLKSDVTQLLYDPDGLENPAVRQGFARIGTAADCLARLRQPEPGKELLFKLKRGGAVLKTPLLTTVRQRPLWRFLPLFPPGRSPEWVLWLWRVNYYDTSARGDSYIGWQINGREGETPVFYRAEQFRQRYHQPNRVARVVRSLAVPTEKAASLELIEPPEVTVEVGAAARGNVPVRVSVRPRGDAEEQQPSEVVLRVNDWTMKTDQKPGRGPQEFNFQVPRDMLRSGENELLAQCFNSDRDASADRRARSDSAPVMVQADIPARPTTAYVITVGIHDYAEVRRRSPGFDISNLKYADKDARSVARAWLGQKGGPLFQQVEEIQLIDQDATRERIQAALEGLKDKVRPDDRLILFISGHGFGKPDEEALPRPGSYAFCNADIDLRDYTKTGVTGADLNRWLSALPCRKLVMLDTCHSGGAALPPDPLRELTPAGVGPVILTASDFKQLSYEAQVFGHGVFTQALLDTVKAGAGQGPLTAEGLVRGIRTRMPDLCKEASVPKHSPQALVPRLEASAPWLQP